MNNFHKVFVIIIFFMVAHCHASELKNVSNTFEHKGMTHAETHSKAHLNNKIIISQPDLEYSLFVHMSRRILEEAYSRLDIKIEFEVFPVERSLATANAGISDGELARIAGLKSIYPNLIQINIPIAFDKVFVYSKKHNFTVDGWQSLKPHRIDHIFGFKFAEQKSQGLNTSKVKTSNQGLNKLIAGRSDLFVGVYGIQCSIKKLKFTDIKVLSPALDELIMYHYLHKRHKSIVEKLEMVLKQMKETGEMEIIQKQVKQEFLNQCGKSNES